MIRFATIAATQFNPVLVWALVVILTFTCLPVAAQMQIPNPLIRPRGLAGQSAATQPPSGTEAATATNAANYGGPPTAPPRPATSPSYAGAVPLPGTVVPTEDPFERNLAELTARFSHFYVSAVVGKQAVLRRNGMDSGTSVSATPSQSSFAPTQPIGLAQNGNKRNESMTLKDGQVLDTVNKAGAMMVKVYDGQVVITYVQESMSLPGGKLIGRSAIAFTGGIESSGGGAIAPIVLERIDPAYKRMISVETKSRSSGNSSSQDNSTSSSSSNAPQIQLSPAP